MAEAWAGDWRDWPKKSELAKLRRGDQTMVGSVEMWRNHPVTQMLIAHLEEHQTQVLYSLLHYSQGSDQSAAQKLSIGLDMLGAVKDLLKDPLEKQQRKDEMK